MRRTQARQTALPTDLSAWVHIDALRCRRCKATPVTVISLGRNDSGAVELCHCTPQCAADDGVALFAHLRSAERGKAQG